MSNKSIFKTPFDDKLKAFAHKLLWANRTFSDCLAVLIAYRVWKEKKDSRYFQRQTGIID
jgi:ATP-dependent RNA helicase TDRD9